LIEVAKTLSLTSIKRISLMINSIKGILLILFIMRILTIVQIGTIMMQKHINSLKILEVFQDSEEQS